MVNKECFLFRTLRIISQSLFVCLTIFPTLISASTITISSEQLIIGLQALDESYGYVGSGFTAPQWNHVDSRTVLPNSNPYELAPSYFSSMFWWNAQQNGSDFVFSGDANTDRAIVAGDYNPNDNKYTSSIVSFNMIFTVEGSGTSLLPQILNGSSTNIATTIIDQTAGTLFSGGELLSGHEYAVDARAQSYNGGGEEQIFRLTFTDAQISLPEPTTLLLMVTGLAGVGFINRKKIKA
jgi:hypothetical protein